MDTARKWSRDKKVRPQYLLFGIGGLFRPAFVRIQGVVRSGVCYGNGKPGGETGKYTRRSHMGLWVNGCFLFASSFSFSSHVGSYYTTHDTQQTGSGLSVLESTSQRMKLYSLLTTSLAAYNLTSSTAFDTCAWHSPMSHDCESASPCHVGIPRSHQISFF